MISLALDSGRNFKHSFRLFSGHFLQTLNRKRPGTGRILPRNFRPESAAKELAESDRNLLNSTGIMPKPAQIPTDPVVGMIDLRIWKE
ncbi:unnamed protein product [Adineta ricciae]|uniref:Uncharacterized protein n=1 Tax=Adineta ricciae TaxID=249248 RepID=A0A816E2E8_ADIRI|nr:unnamed protein product [Adineta ricciae]